jgi:hypothetical protein
MDSMQRYVQSDTKRKICQRDSGSYCATYDENCVVKDEIILQYWRLAVGCYFLEKVNLAKMEHF